jgi:hypothetical protein
MITIEITVITVIVRTGAALGCASFTAGPGAGGLVSVYPTSTVATGQSPSSGPSSQNPNPNPCR